MLFAWVCAEWANPGVFPQLAYLSLDNSNVTGQFAFAIETLSEGIEEGLFCSVTVNVYISLSLSLSLSLPRAPFPPLPCPFWHASSLA